MSEINKKVSNSRDRVGDEDDTVATSQGHQMFIFLPARVSLKREPINLVENQDGYHDGTLNGRKAYESRVLIVVCLRRGEKSISRQCSVVVVDDVDEAPESSI